MGPSWTKRNASVRKVWRRDVPTARDRVADVLLITDKQQIVRMMRKVALMTNVPNTAPNPKNKSSSQSHIIIWCMAMYIILYLVSSLFVEAMGPWRNNIGNDDDNDNVDKRKEKVIDPNESNCIELN